MTSPWNLHAYRDGFVVRFHGEVVAHAASWPEAVATYNRMRAHAAMAMESLRHTLNRENTR